jgi:uncharacterized membrane protein
MRRLPGVVEQPAAAGTHLASGLDPPHRRRGNTEEAPEMATAPLSDPVSAGRRYTVVAVFDDEGQTVRALDDLQVAGFTPPHVSVVVRDPGDRAQLAARSDLAAEGAAVGAASGGVLGALAGFLAGVSALVLPGIGPIVGGGILVAALAGAGAGAAIGALAGALIDQGLPEADARRYERHVADGRYLVTVGAADEALARDAERALKEEAGVEVRRYGPAT